MINACGGALTLTNSSLPSYGGSGSFHPWPGITNTSMEGLVGGPGRTGLALDLPADPVDFLLPAGVTASPREGAGGCGGDYGRSSSPPSTAVVPEAEALIPRELTFTDDALISVITYSALFVLAASGNLTVFVILFRNRRRRSRVNLFIMHLSVADMIVTFVMLPIEIGWHVTVSWQAGDAACRILMFFRVFGFYLSSSILITISLDRYFAITHPLSLNDADRRGRLMLALAWVVSAVASIPQCVIFHVEVHPHFTWFAQCVTFNFFPTPAHELAYNLFNVAAMYVAPLVVIIISYSLILFEMSKKSRESKRQFTKDRSLYPGQTFRRSAIGRIEKARIRTLKMTIVIVLVFLACWTPYFVISAWWWIDQDSAKLIDPKIQRALFIFAVSNSCVNPIVYGMYARTLTRELKKCFCCRRHKADDSSTNNSSSAREQLLCTYPLCKQVHGQINRCENSSKVSRRTLACIGRPRQPQQESLGSGAGNATYFVAVTTEARGPEVTHLRIERKITPPHISQGRGNGGEFDKYLLI